MVLIKPAQGKEKETDCIGCAIVRGEIEPIGGILYNGKHFLVNQDYEIPIPGFMVIGSKRHIKGIGQFNDVEKKEYISLLVRVRNGIEEVLHINYFNFLSREDKIISKETPSHFHTAILPLDDWMKPYTTLDILNYAQNNMKTEDNLEKVKDTAEKIKIYLNNNQSLNLK